MGAAGFWEDAERAAAVSAEHARAARRLETFERAGGDVEDLDGARARWPRRTPSLQAEFDEQIAVGRGSAWRRSRSSGCSPAPTTRATRW